MTERISIALAGNPNSGKTTVFNRLTGARQHVGNYPGVTVEKKEGTCRHRGREIHVVDLPGTYSLTAYSIEELVARNYILRERPDVVVDIVDASNLERNLYLAVQFLELNVPVVLAFNMSDVARQRGLRFDLERLGQLLGAPIVQTVGHRGEGIDELLDEVLHVADGAWKGPAGRIRYGREIEEEIARIEALLAAEGQASAGPDNRWVAVKLLENDAEVRGAIDSPAVLEQVAASVRHLEAVLGDPPEIAIAGRRYGFISGACQEAVRSTVEAQHTLSDRIDTVLTHPVAGIPIFLGLMYALFYLTFTLAEAPTGWLESGFAALGGAVSSLWPADSESVLRSLLVEGIIGGVGGVVTFLPNIVLLFLGIALLEDSGYMARAAFLTDRFMHRIGLHGKSFIPMLLGFGCSVPGILATRTLDSRRDRLVTMLVLPLMSCGARLTIYSLMIPAFFAPRWRAPVLWGIYFIGVLLAVLSAKLLGATLFRGQAPAFVMELPLYRLPTLRGLLIHMWERSWMYLRKAGTIILAVSVVLWALATFPRKPAPAPAGEARAAASRTAEAGPGARTEAAGALRYTVAGRIGGALEPLLRPLGFDWRVSTALVGAFAAKEVFVAQMAIVFSVEADDEQGAKALRRRLQETYTPLQGFCIMLFCLISAPCVATVAVTRKESGSWGWAAFQFAGLTALAYVVTLAVYQVGRLLS